MTTTKRLTAFTAFLMAAAPIAVTGIAPAWAAPMPDAASILDRAIEATGGKVAHKKIHNRVMKERIVHVGMGFEDKSTMYTARPDKRYLVIESDAFGRLRRGTAHGVVWTLDEQMGPQIDTGDALAANLLTAAFDRMANWRKYYRNAELVGTEEVNGKSCFKLVMTPNAGSPETRFYDVDSGLLVKFVKDRPSSSMQTIPITVALSDYKKVDGILLAHKRHQSYDMCGRKVEMIFITDSIEHNVDLPSGLFDLPEEIRQLAETTDSGQQITAGRRAPCGGSNASAQAGSAKPAPCGKPKTDGS